MKAKMTLRVFKKTTRSSYESSAYDDFKCESWEVRDSVLVILRNHKHDLLIPMANIECFHELLEDTDERTIE